MRIVLCTHRFLPRFTGGVEIYTLRLACALRDMGHEVHILTGEPTPKKDLAIDIRTEDYEGIAVTRLEYDFLRRSVIDRASYSDPAITSRIQAILQKLKPDIVHALSLSLLMGGTVEAASNLEIPLVYTATDYVLTCRRGLYVKQNNTICSAKEDLALCTACMGPHTRLEGWLTQAWQIVPQPLAHSLLPVAESVIGKKADFVQAEASIKHRLAYLSKWKNKIERIVAPSTYMREMLVLNSFPSEKIIVSPYGVEAPPANFQKAISPNLRFGFIGRITFIKGAHLLIDAFAALPEVARESVQLTIYGGADINADNYEQEVKRKADHLPNVRFTGKIDNSNISQVYQQLDCLIVPSIWPENSPITILEAQAYGVPVIASDVKGIADLIQHEVNGLIFAHQSAYDLTAQIARCLAWPELVAALAGQSRLVKSIQEDADDMIRLYKEILR